MENAEIASIRAQDGAARKQWAEGRQAQAIESWREAVAQARNLDGEEAGALEAALLCNMSRALAGMGEQELSVKTARLAAETARARAPGQPERLAIALFLLSSIHYGQKDLEAAEAAARQAMEVWEELGNREKAATCMNNLGRIKEEQGKLAEGIAWHQKAVAERRLLPDKGDLAFSLGNLGVALASDGQWEQAAAALGEAIELYAALGLAESRECAGCEYNLDICRKALAGD